MDERKLNAYLDGELDEEESRALEAELDRDRESREEWNRLQLQDRELRDFFSTWQIGRKPRTSKERGLVLKAAAAILIGFGLGYIVFGMKDSSEPDREGPSPPVAQDEQKPEPRPSIGHLVVSTGEVLIRDSEEKEFRILGNLEPIVPGATLRTGDDARCTLRLSDGASLRVERKTELTLQESRRIALDAGRVMAQLGSGGERLDFVAGGMAIVAMNARFDLRQLSERTELVVLEGEARFGGQTVAEGYRGTAEEGAIQGIVRVRDLPLVSSWINELLTLEGHDREELHAQVASLLGQLGRTKMELLYEWEIRSLGEHCVLPLFHFIRSEEPGASRRQKQTAAFILADVAGVAHLERLVLLLEDDDGIVRSHIARGLARIVGQSFGFNNDYWRGDDVTRGRERRNRFLETKR